MTTAGRLALYVIYVLVVLGAGFVFIWFGLGALMSTMSQ